MKRLRFLLGGLFLTLSVSGCLDRQQKPKEPLAPKEINLKVLNSKTIKLPPEKTPE
jgi:hypothetical protein